MRDLYLYGVAATLRRCVGGNISRRRQITRITVFPGDRNDRSLTEDGMEKVATDRIEQQVRSAFPEGAIAQVQVLQHGDDPEVEPG